MSKMTHVQKDAYIEDLRAQLAASYEDNAVLKQRLANGHALLKRERARLENAKIEYRALRANATSAYINLRNRARQLAGVQS